MSFDLGALLVARDWKFKERESEIEKKKKINTEVFCFLKKNLNNSNLFDVGYDALIRELIAVLIRDMENCRGRENEMVWIGI